MDSSTFDNTLTMEKDNKRNLSICRSRKLMNPLNNDVNTLLNSYMNLNKTRRIKLPKLATRKAPLIDACTGTDDRLQQISKQDDQLDLSSLKNEYNSVKIQELLEKRLNIKYQSIDNFQIEKSARSIENSKHIPPSMLKANNNLRIMFYNLSGNKVSNGSSLKCRQKSTLFSVKSKYMNSESKNNLTLHKN